MKLSLKKRLVLPLIFSIYLSLFYPMSSFAMDPKVAREATEKIVSGVKNSLVIGERTGDARVSGQVIKNSGGSIKKVGDNLSISSSASVGNSSTAVVPTSATSAMARNISSSSSSRLSARYDLAREAIQKKSGECRNEEAGITTSSSTSVRNSRTAVTPTSATSTMARNISSSSSSRLSARYDSAREAIQKKSEGFKIKEKTPQRFQVQVITEATAIPVQAVEQIKIEKKATEAVAVGKKSNDEEWQRKEVAKSIESRESCLQSAAEALEKASIATIQNNLPVATLWQKIAPQYQEAAEYHRKSAEAVATGNAEEMGKLRKLLGDHRLSSVCLLKPGLDFAGLAAVESIEEMQRFHNVAAQLSRSACYLKFAIEAFEKARVATTNGNYAMATLWQEVARTKQNIAELYQKTAKDFETGENNDVGWAKGLEEEFNYAESEGKYAEERATHLDGKVNSAEAESNALALLAQNPKKSFRKQKSIFTR